MRERITPLFPLAPLSKAEAHLADASPIVQSSGNTAISFAAAPIVMLIFVPVSPSGTGKILSASTSLRLFAILFEAEITPSRNIFPVIIAE